MLIFSIILILATLLCSLVAGFLFAFAVVVMPGLGRLDDRGFIRAFQVIDGVIQDRQPVFLLVWAGSAVAVIAAGAFGSWELAMMDRIFLVTDRVLVVAAAVIFVLGVHAPTVLVNVPLNNRLQGVKLDEWSEASLAQARAEFESRWNRWNEIRTVIAIVTVVLLLCASV